MGLSDWSPKYTVNHPVMDEHHHTLFKLVDQLSEAIIEKRENEVIREVLNSLLNYTIMHFAAEEKLMRQANYPDLAVHKEAHNAIVAKVQDFQNRFQNGDKSVTAEIAQYLMTDWLVKHILGMDELYAPYFKKEFSGDANRDAKKQGNVN